MQYQEEYAVLRNNADNWIETGLVSANGCPGGSEGPRCRSCARQRALPLYSNLVQCSSGTHAYASTFTRCYSLCEFSFIKSSLRASSGSHISSKERAVLQNLALTSRTAARSVAGFQITLEQLAVRLFLGNIPLLMNTAPEGIA